MPDLMRRLHDLGGPAEDPSGEARARALAHLRDEVTADGRGSRRRRGRRSGRSRRRFGVAAGAVVLGLAAAGAGYAALSGGGEPTVSDGIACQNEASLTPQSTSHMPFDGRSAIAICAELWRRGHVETGTREAPPLQACVARGGGPVRVMPGEDAEVCRELGLEASPGAGTAPRERRYAAFQRDVIRSVHARPGCIPPAEGERIVRATIAEHAMDGWRTEHGGGIRGEGFSAARPCVSLAFDSRRKVVVLVPMVR